MEGREERIFCDGEHVLPNVSEKRNGFYIWKLLLDSSTKYSIDNKTINQRAPSSENAVKFLIKKVYDELGISTFGYNKFFEIDNKGEINGWLCGLFFMDENNFHKLPAYVYEDETFKSFDINDDWEQFKKYYDSIKLENIRVS